MNDQWIFINTEKTKYPQVLFLLVNVHRCTFLPILFISMLELRVFALYTLYFPLSLFCFLKFISGTTWRSFLIFYLNLRGHLINKEAERVFEKNIFLGILGQKDPKWALREACQVWFSKKLNYRVFYSKKILFWFFQPIRGQNGL